MEDSNKHDFLLAQYSAVSDQIVHWDTFFWNKSQFFLAVESVAILGIGNWFVERASTLAQNTAASEAVEFGVELFLIFGAAALLNIYLCVVWLRTGTRNRHFLNMRFDIGRKMEEILKIEPGLYTYQDWKLYKKKLSGPPSHRFEILIPVAFKVVWFLILGYLVTLYIPGKCTAVGVLLWGIFLVLIVIACNEVRRSFDPKMPEAGEVNDEWAEFERYCRQRLPD